MLAQKAGLFVLTLVGDVEGSVVTFSDPHSMNSTIEGLRLMECVHIHVPISISSSDKTFKKQRDELGSWRTQQVPNFVHLARTYRSDRGEADWSS